MRHSLHPFPAFILSLLAFIFCCQSGSAQQLLTPYLSKSGIRAAQREAIDSLGSDARLVFIGTFGELPQTAFSFEFNLANGRSSVWGYTFYSPSRGRTATYVVLDVPIFGFRAQSLGGVLPLPSSLEFALDTSATYFNSDAMVRRLEQDSTYDSYRDRLPEAEPFLITLAHLVQNDSLRLPTGFPLDQPIWTMTFLGRGDTTMTCFVAAGTGETFCLEVQDPTMGVPEAARSRQAVLDVIPNPASGPVRIDITLPEGGSISSDIAVELYDERGGRVLDLAGSYARSGYRFAEFNARGLPSGVYYCRVVGSNWSGLAPVIVGK